MKTTAIPAATAATAAAAVSDIPAGMDEPALNSAEKRMRSGFPAPLPAEKTGAKRAAPGAVYLGERLFWPFPAGEELEAEKRTVWTAQKDAERDRARREAAEAGSLWTPKPVWTAEEREWTREGEKERGGEDGGGLDSGRKRHVSQVPEPMLEVLRLVRWCGNFPVALIPRADRTWGQDHWLNQYLCMDLLHSTEVWMRSKEPSIWFVSLTRTGREVLQQQDPSCREVYLDGWMPPEPVRFRDLAKVRYASRVRRCRTFAEMIVLLRGAGCVLDRERPRRETDIWFLTAGECRRRLARDMPEICSMGCYVGGVICQGDTAWVVMIGRGGDFLYREEEEALAAQAFLTAAERETGPFRKVCLLYAGRPGRNSPLQDVQAGDSCINAWRREQGIPAYSVESSAAGEQALGKVLRGEEAAEKLLKVLPLPQKRRSGQAGGQPEQTEQAELCAGARLQEKGQDRKQGQEQKQKQEEVQKREQKQRQEDSGAGGGEGGE